MFRKRKESDEEREARMAREAAEKAVREASERWPEIVTITDLVREIHSGRNGVAFLDDIAAAMKPRRKRP